MKNLFKIIFSIILVLLIGLVGFWFFLKSTGPTYKGTVDLEGLENPVNIYYDDYGIPHIYAENANDAYHALGYAHAQERLFQMEMIRRLISGRLSEIIGPKALSSDKTFLNLRLREAARRAADKWFANDQDPMVQEAKSYLAGINDFVDHGKLPIEFRLMKIPRQHFDPVDMYCTIEYMALGFTWGLMEEPVLTKMKRDLGDDYIKNWILGVDQMSRDSVKLSQNTELGFFSPRKALEEMSLPLWEGSNAWVLSPERSNSGKVLFANDTHIKFSQPSVWYEAHLEYPGFSCYGNYLAGVPFAVVGHTREHAWGLTIFPADNMDLYEEKVNPNNPLQVWENDHWVDMKTISEKIPVLGGEDVAYDIHLTRHGPVIREAKEYVPTTFDQPISVRWVALEGATTFLQAARALGKAKNMAACRAAGQLVDILGLNIMYGDSKGNIAKWSCGQLPIRPKHVNSKIILDGASGKDEWLGYYDFSHNPKIENPAIGYVTSSNETPPPVDGQIIPGYYPEEGRRDLIDRRLAAKKVWSLEDFKSIHLDHHSDAHLQMANIIIQEVPQKGDNVIVKILKEWDGQYGIEDVGPTVYSKLVYEVLKLAMTDELGKRSFDELKITYLYKNNQQRIIPDDQSPWWDNVQTKDVKETREYIFAQAIDQTEKDLVAQLGRDPKNWKWGRVHTLTHHHPIGMNPTMDKLFHFNVGPFPAPSTNGVINKLAFNMNSEGVYEVISGPALRVLIDFADVEHSQSINPTGQSGSVFSPYYRDQAKMYVDGHYRQQKMNREEIQGNGTKLTLK